MTSLDNKSPTNITKEKDVVESVEPPKNKKKRKSYKSLMKSIMKGTLTEEERIEKQRAKLNSILVDANFKKVDII